MLEIFVDNGFILRSFCFDPSHRSWVDVGWVFGRFGVDLGCIWGRFSVLGGSWEGLWWVLGGLGVAMGAQDRFFRDFGTILRPVLGSKTNQNRSKIDAKMH